MKPLSKEHSSSIHQRVVETFQLTAFIFQIDVLKANYKINAMVYFDFVLLFHYFSSTVHTVVTKWGDLSEVLRSLCLEGINIQLLVKAMTVLYYAPDLYALSQEVAAVHKRSEGSYQDVMYNWAWRIYMIAKVQFVLYIFSSVGFCLYPLYGYFKLNEKTVIYNLLLPFDTETKNGYAITIAIQIFLTYGSTIIIFAVDTLFVLMVFSGAAYIDLLDCDCKALSSEIDKSQLKDGMKKVTTLNGSPRKANAKMESQAQAHKSLVNAIKRSQEVYQYFSRTCSIFEKGCLIQVYSSASTILFCVFVAKTSDWFVVYLIAVSAIYQLSTYCVIGSLIEYKSEEVQKSVYNIPWYKLSIKDQKMLKLLLHYVQNTITITVLGGRKLNVQTGCDVYKTIYSTYVMMEQFYTF